MSAAELKTLGNTAFSAGNFEEAIKHFSQAIELDPSNHVLYSNRSASYCSLKQYDEALTDANKTIEIKPDWPKGYSRKASALHGMYDLDGALEAYDQGLKYDPENALLKKGKQEVEQSMGAGAGSGFGLDSMFQGDIIGKIAANPKISSYLADPEFVRRINAIKSNPQSAAQYMDDPRIMNAMMALMGLDMSAMPGAPGAGPSGGFGGEPAPEYKPTPKADPKPKAAPEPEPEPLSDEAKEELERKNKAVEQKDLGNQFYKKREFEKAIEHYDQAWELDNTNITILTNKAAVLFEQGKFQECIKTCEDAVDVGREYRADFKLIAKAFARIGNAYLKLEDLESAIKFYNKSLSEHRTPDVLNKLKEAEKVKILKDKEAYFDTGLGDQARERGNELFKASKFADAIKEYTEAIKRNEKDYKAYSNRAACYTKLMALFEAEKDCNSCIAIEPTFVKAYIRKAAIEFAKKDFEKSIEILENAKEIDTEGKHTAEINDQIAKANQAMYQAPASSGNPEQDRAEAMKRAQSDPEVMRIMSDPVMQQILQQMQTDPRAIQEHMKNPSIASNIRKLINVGIIRMG